MEVSCQFHTPAASNHGKEPTVPIGHEVGWVPEPVWALWNREKSLDPTGTRRVRQKIKQPQAGNFTVNFYETTRRYVPKDITLQSNVIHKSVASC
jgi:hypothetical protein